MLGDGTGYLASVNDTGTTTHQILSNYQMRQLGGEGYLRLLEFLPDGRTVRVRTYSPVYEKFLLDPDQHLGTVVVAEANGAEVQDLVAPREVAGLTAGERHVSDEEGTPLGALSMEHGEKGALEGEAARGDDASGGDPGRQIVDRADSFDQELGIAVSVEIDLLDARQLREGDLRAREAGAS